MVNRNLDVYKRQGLSYESHARDASLLEVLKQSRERDKIMGFSLRGIHKDELNICLLYTSYQFGIGR